MGDGWITESDNEQKCPKAEKKKKINSKANIQEEEKIKTGIVMSK
jgi:hypothetical protein